METKNIALSPAPSIVLPELVGKPSARPVTPVSSELTPLNTQGQLSTTGASVQHLADADAQARRGALRHVATGLAEKLAARLGVEMHDDDTMGSRLRRKFAGAKEMAVSELIKTVGIYKKAVATGNMALAHSILKSRNLENTNLVSPQDAQAGKAFYALNELKPYVYLLLFRHLAKSPTPEQVNAAAVTESVRKLFSPGDPRLYGTGEWMLPEYDSLVRNCPPIDEHTDPVAFIAQLNLAEPAAPAA